VSEYLLPRQGSDLRKSVLVVVWVHCKDFLSGGGSQDFNDLDKLVDTTLAREDRLAEHQFSNDATY